MQFDNVILFPIFHYSNLLNTPELVPFLILFALGHELGPICVHFGGNLVVSQSVGWRREKEQE